MRFINGIFTAQLGDTVSNREAAVHFRQAVASLPVDELHRRRLLESLDYFLMGERTRQAVPNWNELLTFAERAGAFERGAAEALASLSRQIRENVEGGGVVFDAVLTTTSTGSLMPGLSYRLAAQLPGLVRTDSLMIDLAHVGCTGGLKLLTLLRRLDESVRNCLVVSVELPTTLINMSATDVDVWQGNCTFGDGAAALWVSSDGQQGGVSLSLRDLQYFQHSGTGLDLIRWGYADYYTFRLADDTTFNRDVRSFIIQSLSHLDPALLESPHWAIHPAGLALLMRLSRKLGLNRKALRPATDHYQRYSNMSSAGVLHILADIAEAAEAGAELNLLTMGAGFNVIYGNLRKER